jgi:hypothetical protein
MSVSLAQLGQAINIRVGLATRGRSGPDYRFAEKVWPNRVKRA